MKKQLVIYGAGGFGREVLSLVRALPEWDVIGFADDNLTSETIVGGVPVLGGRDFLQNYNQTLNVVIAIGDPFIKEKVINGLVNPALQFPTLIHPSVIIQDQETVRVGSGSIVCAGSILTTNIVTDEHVLINLNVTIGHDVRIGKYTSVMPGVNVAGEVTIGRSVLIGSGSNILNRVELGDSAIIGMGSVVLQNVSADRTVAGVPAKEIK